MTRGPARSPGRSRSPWRPTRLRWLLTPPSDPVAIQQAQDALGEAQRAHEAARHLHDQTRGWAPRRATRRGLREAEERVHRTRVALERLDGTVQRVHKALVGIICLGLLLTGVIVATLPTEGSTAQTSFGSPTLGATRCPGTWQASYTGVGGDYPATSYTQVAYVNDSHVLETLRAAGRDNVEVHVSERYHDHDPHGPDCDGWYIIAAAEAT